MSQNINIFNKLDSHDLIHRLEEKIRACKVLSVNKGAFDQSPPKVGRDNSGGCPALGAGSLTFEGEQDLKSMEEGKIRTLKILIVDDEYLIRWSLCQALMQEGYEVTAIDNGKEAVEAARNHRFDFIITDLVMPESSGWEVLRHVKQMKSQPRVVIITAHGEEDTKEIAIKRGAWAYVEKPYIIDRIKGILKEFAEAS
jgi:CheY-like chemotaxis protein